MGPAVRPTDTELSVEAVNGRARLALRRAGRAIAVVGGRAAGTMSRGPGRVSVRATPEKWSWR